MARPDFEGKLTSSYYCTECGLVLEFCRRIVGGLDGPRRMMFPRNCPVCRGTKNFQLLNVTPENVDA